MDADRFLALFVEQFDETPLEQFSYDTFFRSLDEWSSLTALSVIAMIDEEYDVTIKGDDIRNSGTINDLYQIVLERSGNKQKD